MDIREYTLQQTIKNGNTRVQETAMHYDGTRLDVMRNVDGTVAYESIPIEDLLREYSPSSRSLISRLTGKRKRKHRKSVKAIRSKSRRKSTRSNRRHRTRKSR